MIEHIDQVITIKDYLKTLTISKALIKRIKTDGDFLVNGKHQTVRYLMQPGDVFEIVLPQEKSTIIAQNIPLNIVYEDQYYLVIDKQAGIPCIPTKRYPHLTLANGIMYYYQTHNLPYTVHLVNRLDKETSGLMLVAKDSRSHYLLSKDIKQVKRVYHCLVDGYLQGHGIIDKPIAKDTNSIKRYIADSGKPSVTHYRVLQHYSHQTLVECILKTGRTHQIRVHLSSLQHPLSGDHLYGSLSQEPFYLDSVELSFVHPYTQQLIQLKKAEKPF